jgi:membrane-associated phospholipid phosphatase
MLPIYLSPLLNEGRKVDLHMVAKDEPIGRNRPLGTALTDLLREVGPAAVLGLAGSLALLMLFGWLVEEIFHDPSLRLDNSLAEAIHGWANPQLDAVFGFMSTVGGVFGVPIILALAFAVLVWRHYPHHAWRLVVAVAGGLILNVAFKYIFQRPRPALWPHADVSGFSFPSGHATVALCLFGMLGWLGLRLFRPHAAGIAWAVFMAALIVLIGLSRIYLGVHYPSDVLAGYISGSFWLLMLWTGSDILARLRQWRLTDSTTDHPEINPNQEETR